MNKKSIIATFVIVSAFLAGSLIETKDKNIVTVLTPNNIESLTNCENIDKMDCDGHCVEDNLGIKFCASPGWHKKNCRMGYY